MSVLRKLVISWHAELLTGAMAGGIIGIRTGL
jgi:hypothetical protein